MHRSLALGTAALLLISAATIAGIRFNALHEPSGEDLQPLAPAPPLSPDETWKQIAQGGVAPELHQALQAHRGLAQAIATVPPENASIDGLLALAPYSLDPRLREQLTVSLQISPTELSVLVGNPVGRAILGRCPEPRLDLLCKPAWRKERMAAMSEILVDLLGSSEDVLASRALDQVCLMGSPAQPIAETALRSDSLRARAVGLVAAGCVFEEERAKELMKQHLDPSDPLAPIAALELGRLGHSGSALTQLEQKSQGEPLSLFAAYGLSSAKSSTQERSSP
jgi:hypothetical protein